ncbi:MAG TPA: zf-HC2 domain-containing protein [Telluria sp.]
MADQERVRFAAHLHNCALCQRELQALTSLQRDLRDLPSPVLGFDLSARLEENIRRANVPRRPARSLWNLWPSWGPTGVATAASLACGIWLGALVTGATVAGAPPAAMARVFDPVPPGGLCAAPELCRLSKGMQ